MELLFIIVGSLLLSAYFSGSEMAFVSANRLRVEVASSRYGWLGPTTVRLLKDPRAYLTTTLVGNNLALVAYSTFFAIALEPWITQSLLWLGLSEESYPVVLLTSQTLVASFLVLVVGEIIPKTIFREIADRAVFWLSVPLRIFQVLLFPLVTLAGISAQSLMRLTGQRDQPFQGFLRRDFELIMEETAAEGSLALDEDEREMLSNALNLASVRVKDSMVPRTDVVAISDDASMAELRQRFVESGHSKLPVFQQSIDCITGVVFAHDLFGEPESIAAIAQKPYFVPESKRSKDLLTEFLASKTSIAIVIDEYGGTAGLVTLEDLIEELVGDIQDEYDLDETILRTSPDGSVVSSGRVELEMLAEETGISLPEGDYETVAGFVLDHAGRIPRVREEIVTHGFRFTVLQSSSRRIDLVRIRAEGESAAE